MQPKKGNLEAGVVMGADRGIYSPESHRFHECLCFNQFYSLCRAGGLPKLDIYSLFSQAHDSAPSECKLVQREMVVPLASFGQSKQSELVKGV